jgi:hypothetical protein
MRRARTLFCFLGLMLLSPQGAAAEPAGGAGASPQEARAPDVPDEPSHAARLRDYMDQVRAQRRAQIERLRQESRDDSERAWQQRRESADEQSRLHREQRERLWEPQFPIGTPPTDEWSNPWYYRGW